MFYLVGVGQSRWRIVHRITDLPAGNIARMGNGFLLRDDEEREIGGFDSISSALEQLYALA